MEKRYALADDGRQLWTRELARAIRGKLVELLDALAPGDTLVIDAGGVEVFDYSFANELFGKTLLSIPPEYPGRFVIVENLTAYTHENLGKALEGLGLIMIERKRRKLHLLGKVHPVDQQTFAAVVAEGEPVLASTLSRKLGLNLTAVNERLTKLTNLAVLRREKSVSEAGREQYAYSVLV